VVAAVDRADVRTVSFMTFLFQPEVVDWLEQLRRSAEEHGPWEALQISLAGSIDVSGSPYANSVWRREHGGLWDWGPHALALVRSLLPPVERVSATRGPRDTVNVALEHAGGPSSLLTLTVTAPEAATHTTATVWGPGGRHQLELPSGNLREAYARAFGQLRESIRSGTPHPLDAAYGRGSVAILDAARRNLQRPSGLRMDVPVGVR
jgi:predicted dehydrogenase